MEVQRDFKELLALFNAHDVAYIIVGAYALAYYGSPRYTGDMDILVRPAQWGLTKVKDFLCVNNLSGRSSFTGYAV